MNQISILVIVLLCTAAAATVRKDSILSNRSVRPVTNDVKNSTDRAVTYLLSRRLLDYGWGTSAATSRANVAMAFAERISTKNQNETNLMKKQLDIQLSLDLIPPSTVGLGDLALYVNSIYATCQDPRDFQGMDLVGLLRTETSKALASNFSLPFVLMTLCVADASIYQDYQALTSIYNVNSRISIKAISVLAMVCSRQKTRQPSMFSSYLTDFAQRIAALDSNLDVHSKALAVQAANAANLKHNLNLERNQQEDGSFGDLLATYYAIPALMNTSLLDLKCRGSNEVSGRLALIAMNPSDKKVTISLWIASDTDYNTHSMVLTFKSNETLYDIMKMAESKDSMYRFLCDETKNGKEVFFLAGVPNDPEKGMLWRLYQARSDSIAIEPKSLNRMEPRANMMELTNGVDHIFPQDRSHLVFWFDHD